MSINQIKSKEYVEKFKKANKTRTAVEVAICQQDEIKTYLNKESTILNRHIYIQQRYLNPGGRYMEDKKTNRAFNDMYIVAQKRLENKLPIDIAKKAEVVFM